MKNKEYGFGKNEEKQPKHNKFRSFKKESDVFDNIRDLVKSLDSYTSPEIVEHLHKKYIEKIYTEKTFKFEKILEMDKENHKKTYNQLINLRKEDDSFQVVAKILPFLNYKNEMELNNVLEILINYSLTSNNFSPLEEFLDIYGKQIDKNTLFKYLQSTLVYLGSKKDKFKDLIVSLLLKAYKEKNSIGIAKMLINKSLEKLKTINDVITEQDEFYIYLSVFKNTFEVLHLYLEFEEREYIIKELTEILKTKKDIGFETFVHICNGNY